MSTANNEAIKSRVSEIISKANCYPFLFIGSGMSMRYMGTRTWEGLLRWACDEILGDEFAYARLSGEAGGDFPQVASLLEIEANRILLSDVKFNAFRERHSSELKDGASPMKTFIAEDLSMAVVAECEETYLLKERCADKISGVITTNYDSLAETLFPGCDVFVGEEELLFREVSYSAEIYKIHGCASSPDTMVLNSADYARFREKQAYLAAKILTIFAEYPVIFLGYSINDDNIREILSSIAKCAGGGRLSSLADRFIFVQYGDSVPAVSEATFVFGDETMVMTNIVTRDFAPIFEAISESRTMYDPKVVRTLRKCVYGIASRIDPSSAVAVSGFSNLDRLDDDARIVIGFSPVNEGYGRMPSAEELYKDALFDDLGLDQSLVVSDYLPKLLKSNSGGLPMFKYLKGCEIAVLDDRIERQIDEHGTLESYFNAGQRSTAPGWRATLESYTIDGLVSAFGSGKAYERLAALTEEEMDPGELRAYLSEYVSQNGGVECIRGNSELKRAIRVWDYLEYGPYKAE